MSMLSKVANRLYWMARYLERAESTARLCESYSQVILDIPQGTGPDWFTLIKVIDGQTEFYSRYKITSERNILKFMMSDMDNSSSIPRSIRAARENVRTTRDVLPEEIWELMNELRMYVDEESGRAVTRRHRFDFLQGVVERNQRIAGLIESAASRDHAYGFIKMGRLIERADMSTRIIDAATEAVRLDKDREIPDHSLIWASALKAVSGISAFRRTVGPLYENEDVLDFFFKNKTFPRSVEFCLIGIAEVTSYLSNSESVDKELAKLQRMVKKYDANKFTLNETHGFIDTFQEELIALDEKIAKTWFLHDEG
ncbi:alpha-E domain-containing protein [Granulosicoccaceae sp. 1_MG-2023]|nr:alpha-E domain-containing protein [Granulosicoccaceae sp. 1_MG-2023]